MPFNPHMKFSISKCLLTKDDSISNWPIVIIFFSQIKKIPKLIAFWSIVVNSSSIETIVSFVRIGISILKASIDDEISFKCLYSLGSIGS